MNIDVVKKDNGYWLVLNGKVKATIHLGNHGEIVTAALEEAVQQKHEADTPCVKCGGISAHKINCEDEISFA